MQSIRGGRTSSQQCQFQELSQPQHSRTHKSYFQGRSCERASLLCPIRWRKEPCDSQQRNEDQNAHRKVIDHVRKTRGHLLTSKPVGEDQTQRPLSVPCLRRGPEPELRISWKRPFLIVWRLPKQGKEIRDRHHVLVFFGSGMRQASEGKRTPCKERGPPFSGPKLRNSDDRRDLWARDSRL